MLLLLLLLTKFKKISLDVGRRSLEFPDDAAIDEIAFASVAVVAAVAAVAAAVVVE